MGMRKRQCVAVFIILSLLLNLSGYAFAGGFFDVKGHWAESQINTWAEKDLAGGYADGSFRPNNTITRAEFVSMTNRVFAIKGTDEVTSHFDDVRFGQWFYEDISAAKKAGYIGGYSDGTFQPNQRIQRQEAASILVRLLGLEPTTEGVEEFKDEEQIPQWSRSNIGSTAKNGLMRGMPDNTFRPLQSITRAEALVSLDRAMNFSVEKESPIESAIDGTVTFDGDTMGNTIIKIFKAGSYEFIKETETDDIGYFKVKLEPGDYDITAAAGNKIACRESITVNGKALTTVDLTLEEAAVVKGVLQNRFGNAVENTIVMFTGNATFFNQTNEEGEFIVVVMPGQKYTVRAYEPGKEGREPSVVVRNLEVSSEGELDVGILKAPFPFRLSSNNSSSSSRPGTGNEPEQTLDLEVLKVEGNIVNDNGGMLTFVVGGDIKSINNKADVEALDIKVEGVVPDICTFEDLDCDFIPDVLNLYVRKANIWDAIKSERQFAITMNGQPSFTGNIDELRGGCSGSDGGGCGDSGCGDDHSDGGCGSEESVAYEVYGEQTAATVTGLTYGPENYAPESVIENTYGDGDITHDHEGEQTVVGEVYVEVKRTTVNSKGFVPISISGDINLVDETNIKVEDLQPDRIEIDGDSLMVLISMSKIWDDVQDGYLTLNCNGQEHYQPLEVREIVTSGDEHEDESCGGGCGCGMDYSVVDSVYGIDIVKVKGNIKNGQGKKLKVVVAGDIDSFRDSIAELETINIDGVYNEKCTLECTDLDFQPEVLNVHFNKQKLKEGPKEDMIWKQIKDSGEITLSMTYKGNPLTITKSLYVGRGSNPNDSHGGGGCGEDHSSGEDSGCNH